MGKTAKEKLRVCLLLFSIIAVAAQAGSNPYQAGSNPYTDMVGEVFVSPRSAAMSRADLAINPSGSLVSNPAVIALPALSQLSLSYASYFHDVFSTSIMNYNGSVGTNGGLGVSAAYLLVPGIEDTRAVDTSGIDTDNIDLFTSSDVWVRIGYGRRYEAEKFAFYYGAALNARRRRLELETAHGLGMDAGVMLHLPEQSLYFSLLLENVKSSFVRWSGADYVEHGLPHLRFSAAFERDFPYVYGSLALVFTSPDLLSNEGINDVEEDVYYRDDQGKPIIVKYTERPSLVLANGRYGLEYTIMNTFSLRAGFSQSDFSLGAGLNLLEERAGLDFSYLNHQLAATYKMSVTYRWH
ncbi:MAG: hypothetical protein ACOCXC_02220 [Fibrobacterota bacterium]